jgi:coniferyl-aldehyde dehydrogenase
VTSLLDETGTQIDTLRDAFDRQQSAFRQFAPLQYTQRVEALDALLHGVLHYEDTFIKALKADFGNRSSHETRLLEMFPLVDEIRYVKRHLRRWMQPRAVAVNWQFLPSRARIVYQPLGVVGIIGAWNYQLLLTLSPLANALAAGNHVMIKPSELAPATAEAMQKMISGLFPAEYVTVITGGKEISAAFASLPFDHLIFTGSTRVGKLVMKAAAENLTPVTLELGGKSPALVHESYPMSIAADRICSAKFWNGGQTCVAPDYALVPSHRVREFVQHAESVISRRYPRLASNADYTSMIHQSAWRRMQELVDDAANKGAVVVEINPAKDTFTAENRVFPPTLLLNTDGSMRIMQEEIFGPILPVVSYSSLDDALAFINARPRPLALYYFDRNDKRIDKVLKKTVSGGVTVNDCIFHFPQHRLPFGGVGPSGMGAYHGRDGFETSSKKKGVFLQNSLVGSFLDRVFKPPYNAWTDRMIALLMRRDKRHNMQRMSLAKEK